MEHQQCHDRTFRVRVNTQQQEPWDNLLRKLLPFLEFSNECLGDSERDPKLRTIIVDYGEHHGRAEYERHLTRTLDSWRQILESQTLTQNVLFTDRRESSIEITFPKGTLKPSATSKNCTKPTKKAPQLLDLPCEIFEHIFQHVVGSYEVKGFLLRLFDHGYLRNISTQLILYKPRSWAELKVFHICRAFRHLAICYYGVPQKDGFPFNPKVDTMVIRGEKRNYFGEKRAVCGVAFPPNLKLQDWKDDDHWLYYDGVYSFNETMGRVRPWSKVTKISAECLRKPTEITLDIFDGTAYTILAWKQVWHFLGQTGLRTGSMYPITYTLSVNYGKREKNLLRDGSSLT
ncbi:hypothetical protein F5Y11DRAFT_367299 [Daldinia sp. FL1419]|nr:hypothetical protein F5Y11DRAFT_367299 [Daldinia sp. FL1419]